MKGMNPLAYWPLYRGAVLRLVKLEPWIRTWLGENITSISAKDWFYHKGDNIMWDLLWLQQIQHCKYFGLKSLSDVQATLNGGSSANMKTSLIKQMGKVVDLLFTAPIGTPFWGLGEHEHLIIALFLSIVLRMNWKGTWTIHGSYWGCVSVRANEILPINPHPTKIGRASWGEG